jgi:hypothetical protein
LSSARDAAGARHTSALLMVGWWLLNIAFVVWQVRVLTGARSRAIYQDEHFLDRLVIRGV